MVLFVAMCICAHHSVGLSTKGLLSTPVATSLPSCYFISCCQCIGAGLDLWMANGLAMGLANRWQGSAFSMTVCRCVFQVLIARLLPVLAALASQGFPRLVFYWCTLSVGCSFPDMVGCFFRCLWRPWALFLVYCFFSFEERACQSSCEAFFFLGTKPQMTALYCCHAKGGN